MFPRRQRLLRTHFPAPGTPTPRVTSSFFAVSLPTGVRGYAVVVSKKVLRRSVDRHRFKRRVVAALRALTLPEALVVYPRAAATRLTAAELRAELELLLSKIRK